MGCAPSSATSVLEDQNDRGKMEHQDTGSRYAVAGHEDDDSTAAGLSVGKGVKEGESKAAEGELTDIGDFNVERGGRGGSRRGKRRTRGAEDDEDMEEAMKRLKEKVRKESERKKRRKGKNSGHNLVETHMRAGKRNIIMNEIKSDTPFSASGGDNQAEALSTKYFGGKHGENIETDNNGAHLQASEMSGLPGLRLKQF